MAQATELTEATGGAATKVTRTAAEILAAAPKVGTDEVFIPEWDSTVKVTGIGKVKQRAIQAEATDEKGEVDQDVVEKAMFRDGVLEPKFSEPEIEKLWETAPGPINKVLLRILQLSGATTTDPVKTAVRTFPEGSEPAV